MPGLSQFPTYLYFSGVTFLTLGYGDIIPLNGIGRALAVGEAGLGFGFLAIVVSYLPMMNQAFSRREIAIACWMPGLVPLPPLPNC